MQNNLVTQIISKALLLIRKKPVVVVLKMSGIIGQGSGLKSGLNLSSFDEKIESAFSSSNVQAVALIINSPGGSPVQSELIYNKIRNLSQEKKIMILSFVEDVAASGGFWLACAGDKIYAAQNSVIGSIGVVSSGFGFYKVIEKLGIERRVYTQGKSKSILDPFMPEKKDDIQILKQVQKDIYENFKDLVLSRRTNIEKKNHDEIFSGAFWSSKKAKELGLIDEIGNFHSVIREKFGKKITIKKINSEKSWLKSLLGSAIGIVMDKLLSSLEERSIRSRYDL